MTELRQNMKVPQQLSSLRPHKKIAGPRLQLCSVFECYELLKISGARRRSLDYPQSESLRDILTRIVRVKNDFICKLRPK